MPGLSRCLKGLCPAREIPGALTDSALPGRAERGAGVAQAQGLSLGTAGRWRKAGPSPRLRPARPAGAAATALPGAAADALEARRGEAK